LSANNRLKYTRPFDINKILAIQVIKINNYKFNKLDEIQIMSISFD